MSQNVHYVRVGSGPVDGANFRKMAKEFPTILNNEFAALGEDAKGEAQGFIDIAGTFQYWSGAFTDVHQGGGKRSHSGKGRKNTGAMRDAIDFRIVKGSHFGLGLDVGWINDDWEPYMSAQDSGFTHAGYRRESQKVQGMGMFQHLRVYMRGKVSEAADRVIERVADGL